MNLLKLILRPLKIVAIIVVVFVILVVGAVGLLNTSSVQDKFLSYATDMLQEKLQTKVSIDSIRIGFFSDDVRLYNLQVEDLQHRPMLKLERFAVEIDMLALLNSEVQIEEISVKGLHAKLYQERRDTAANYQFVIDAFKKDKKAPEKKPKEEQKKKKKELTLDLKRVVVEDVDLVFNEQHAAIGKLRIKKDLHERLSGTIQQVAGSWVHHKKKAPVHVDNNLLVDAIAFEETADGKGIISIDSVHWTTDNHLPHKRAKKPKRGWFDDGHMKVVAHLKVELTHADKDSIVGQLAECDVHDVASGLHITDLHLKFKQQGEKLLVNDAVIGMKNTKLNFKEAVIQLPSKKKGRPFLFQTTPITGTTLLMDIAHPFAPALKNFKLPLQLSTKFNGTDSTLTFRDITVKTPDGKVHIRGYGGIEGLKDKYKLNVHFNITKATIQGNSKERIINQFTVRKFMMKQLHTLGTINYTGSFNVLYKKLQFRGTIGSACGSLNFGLQIDALSHYLTGHVKSTNFELGKAMDYPKMGKVTCSAGFRFDISKPRTAQMRRVKGGKLPIGQVDALVDEAYLEGMRFSNVAAHIVSDGAVAEGKINMKGKLADILCSFSFTNTDEMKKTKIKPGIRFHLFDKKTDEEKAQEKAEKEKRKAQKAAEKEKRKAEKAKLKAEKEKLRAAEEAEEAKAKALRKAEKAAEKEKRKAEKAARKEQKRLEKERRKAEKAAAKAQDN